MAAGALSVDMIIFSSGTDLPTLMSAIPKVPLSRVKIVVCLVSLRLFTPLWKKCEDSGK